MADSLSQGTNRSELRHPTARSGGVSAQRLAQQVWRWVGNARPMILLLCTLGALALAALLLPLTWAGLDALGDLADLDALLDGLARGRLATARLLRLGLGLAVALAALALMTLAYPTWSPPPVSRLACTDFRLPYPIGRSKQRVAGTLALTGQDVAWRPTGSATIYGAGQRLGSVRWLVAALPLGFLILSVAFGVYAAFGWSGDAQSLVVGEERYLDADRSLVAFLDELVIVPDANGSIQSLSSRLTVTSEGRPPVTLSLDSGRRATVRGIALYGLGYGPAVRVQAQATAGQRLELRQLLGDPQHARAVRVAFVDEQQERWLAIPDRSLLIRMLYYAQTPQGSQEARLEPSIHLQVIRGRDGQVLKELFLEKSDRVSVEDLVVDVAFEYYVMIQARRELHLPLAALGAVLSALGFVAWMVWPPREAWVVLHEDQEPATFGQLCVRPRQARSAWFGDVQALLSEETEATPEALASEKTETSTS